MPIPKPRKGEKKDDFLKRCMADEVMKREYPDRKQRYAICNAQLKDRKGDTTMAFRHNSKTADNEPRWSEVDKTALPRQAFADMGEEGKKSTWKYPHHWVKGGTKKDDEGIWVDGELLLHTGGLKAAWAAANGARSGKKAPQHVIDHLQAHRSTIKTSAIGAMAADPWLIEPSWLQTMYDVVMRNGDPEALAVKVGEDGGGFELRDNVGVIPVRGPIFRYANLFTEISGATSTGKLAKSINKAIEDPGVKKVILKFDSPGGQVTGINELTKIIKEGAEKKPIIAYVEGSAASAAYWLASAASEIVADETALVGSIGVVATFRKREDDTVEIVSSNAPRKRPDINTKEGKDEVRKTLDAIADVFVEAVAENRGVDKQYVLDNFGQGGVLVGRAALAVGMIDRLGSFESIIREDEGGKEMSAELTKEILMEKYPDLAKELVEEGKREAFSVTEKRIMELQKTMFKKDMTAKIGEDAAKMLVPLFGKVEQETIDAIADEIARLQAVINDLGAQKGSAEVSEPKDEDYTDEEIEKYAKEHGLQRHEAVIELEKMRAMRRK